jgi:hypothetical protein
MKSRLLASAFLVIVLLAVSIAGWVIAYPDRGDPNNLRYVVWKAGLWHISLENDSRCQRGQIGDWQDERRAATKASDICLFLVKG